MKQDSKWSHPSTGIQHGIQSTNQATFKRKRSAPLSTGTDLQAAHLQHHSPCKATVVCIWTPRHHCPVLPPTSQDPTPCGPQLWLPATRFLALGTGSCISRHTAQILNISEYSERGTLDKSPNLAKHSHFSESQYRRHYEPVNERF